ncbi:MAG: serine endopeptidase, partial [Massilia sp.]
MQRALWLVALVFAGFLIGLGGKIVENIWDVEAPLTLEQFVDPAQGPVVRAAAEQADRNKSEAERQLQQADQKHQVAQANTQAAQETFQNWIATRRSTARPDQDPEVIARTRDLDTLKAAERQALGAVEVQQQALLDATQARQKAAVQLEKLEQPAR